MAGAHRVPKTWRWISALVAVGMAHGPRRKMTPTANTSISAVGVLCLPGPERMPLQGYHNRHAAIPINPDLLRAPEVSQFALRDDPRRTTEWEGV